MQEIQVQSLGKEVPLEKEMTTHFSILAWKIPWTEEPSGLQSMGVAKNPTNQHFHLSNSNQSLLQGHIKALY